MTSRTARALCVGLFGLLLSCIDPESAGGSTAGTTLIAFDVAEGASRRLLMWDNLDELLTTANPAPTRYLQDDRLNQVKDLAWGGLCLDAPGHVLYAVSANGDVLRVRNIHKQNGKVQVDDDVFVFRLDGDRLSQGKFEQASLDAQRRTLYVMESNDTEARVWAVADPQNVTSSTVQASRITVEGGREKLGTGLAARSGDLFAFFRDGATVTDPQKTQYEGARLRLGNGGSFAQSRNVIIGDKTGLARYSTLAVDNTDRVYVARHLVDAGIASGKPLLVFRRSQFDTSYNLAPHSEVGDPALRNLRIIHHAGTKDWLVGADMVADAPGATLHLWKQVSQGGGHTDLNAGSGVQIKGVVLDGSR